MRDLHPAYFAMVMSTGIVSIAFHGLGVESVAQVLFAINILAFASLLYLFVGRIVFYWEYFIADLTSPQRCWGFLTFVVATNTLGSQVHMFRTSTLGDALIIEPIRLAQGLWLIGLVTWVLFIYAIYCNLIAHQSNPVEDIISGSSLLTVVSTQSVAVLGSMLADTFGFLGKFVSMVSLTHFATGWVLYIIVTVLVTYRLLSRPLTPSDWSGSYWICMGAAAITTLAGSNILLYLDVGNQYNATLIVTFLAWAMAAWWIPIQLYLDIWKFNRINIQGETPGWIQCFPWLRLGFGATRHHFYEPLSWGRVFPMGMFTACTIALVRASEFSILWIIPAIWGWFALAVWSLTFIGMLRSLSVSFNRKVSRDQQV